MYSSFGKNVFKRATELQLFVIMDIGDERKCLVGKSGIKYNVILYRDIDHSSGVGFLTFNKNSPSYSSVKLVEELLPY